MLGTGAKPDASSFLGNVVGVTAESPEKQYQNMMEKMTVEIPHQEYAMPQDDEVLREEAGIVIKRKYSKKKKASDASKSSVTEAPKDPVETFFEKDAEDRAKGVCRRQVDFAVMAFIHGTCRPRKEVVEEKFEKYFGYLARCEEDFGI